MKKKVNDSHLDSLREQVGRDDTYKHLPMGEYLDALDIINRIKPGDREAAKLKLALANYRLINAELRKEVKRYRATAGLTESTDRIDSGVLSKMFIEIAVGLHQDMSQIAADTPRGNLISGIVLKRVANRIVDELRALNADKRTIADGVGPSFTDEDGLLYMADNNTANQFNSMQQRLIAEEYVALVKQRELDESELQVVEFIEYGIKTRQHFPIAEIARRLKKPVGTVRDVYARVIQRLRQIANDEGN